MSNKRIIIAIDGHSSCGKSTLAKQLAAYLNYRYIDSGAMYRAITLYALRNKLIENGTVDVGRLIAKLGQINIDFSYNPVQGKCDIYMNGQIIEEKIRSMEVSNAVSLIAVIPEVRRAMVHQQQSIGKDKGVVMDGRDIGTVVFPQAELKIFMTASPDIRARRRYDEMKGKGMDVVFTDVLNNVNERDRIDSTRAHSPLVKAKDAIELDNSKLDQDAQLAWAINLVNQYVNE